MRYIRHILLCLVVLSTLQGCYVDPGSVSTSVGVGVSTHSYYPHRDGWYYDRPQIPPDLVVKSQAIDIIDIILQPIRPPNGVSRVWRNRKSRGMLLSTSAVQ